MENVPVTSQPQITESNVHDLDQRLRDAVSWNTQPVQPILDELAAIFETIQRSEIKIGDRILSNILRCSIRYDHMRLFDAVLKYGINKRTPSGYELLNVAFITTAKYDRIEMAAKLYKLGPDERAYESEFLHTASVKMQIALFKTL